MLNVNDNPETFKVKVLVQFAQPNGTVKQGDFMATYRREAPEKVQAAIDAGVSNIELLFRGWVDSTEVDDNGTVQPRDVDGVLLEVEGIGRSPTDPLPAAEALAWVRKSAECVNAAAVAFIKATRAERYIEETSKKRVSRG